MSIITEALKLATSQEKLISKQEMEIAKLKDQVNSLTIAKAAADEDTRIAREALKAANAVARMEIKEANRVTKEALKGAREAHAANVSVLNDESKELKKEVRELTAQLKLAQKAPTWKMRNASPEVQAAAQAGDVPKKRPGRPKKVVAAEPEAPEVPEVDPRQLNIPDLGEPANIQPEMEKLAELNSDTVSAKGFNYEFV